MKAMRYILLALALPVAVSMSAQKLAGSQVQLDNKSITMGADTQVMVGMDVTVPATMELSTNSLLTLTPVLVSKDNAHNKVLPAIYVYGRNRQLVDMRNNHFPKNAFTRIIQFCLFKGDLGMGIPGAAVKIGDDDFIFFHGKSSFCMDVIKFSADFQGECAFI